MFASLKKSITNIKTAIPEAVRARVMDYAITMLLSAVFITSCLVLVFDRLNKEFVKISNLLP
jgi:hypothetical protein